MRTECTVPQERGCPVSADGGVRTSVGRGEERHGLGELDPIRAAAPEVHAKPDHRAGVSWKRGRVEEFPCESCEHLSALERERAKQARSARAHETGENKQTETELDHPLGLECAGRRIPLWSGRFTGRCGAAGQSEPRAAACQASNA